MKHVVVFYLFPRICIFLFFIRPYGGLFSILFCGRFNILYISEAKYPLLFPSCQFVCLSVGPKLYILISIFKILWLKLLVFF